MKRIIVRKGQIQHSIVKQILKGRTDAEAAQRVRDKHGSRTTPECVAWYRNKIAKNRVAVAVTPL